MGKSARKPHQYRILRAKGHINQRLGFGDLMKDRRYKEGILWIRQLRSSLAKGKDVRGNYEFPLIGAGLESLDQPVG